MAGFLVLFGLYYFVRGLPADRVELATRNADRIIDLERALGVFRELSWQQAALDRQWLMDLGNFVYMYLHLPVLLAAGFIFFHVDGRKYRVLRNALLFSGFLAGVIYWLLPVTPPRLLAESGFVDTIGDIRRAKPGPLANNYAAIPSYHFGWILLIVIGAWWETKSLAPRFAAVAFLALMTWAIVATGNHYFLDMALGGVMVILALLLSLRFERWMEAPGGGRHWRPCLRFGPVRFPF